MKHLTIIITLFFYGVMPVMAFDRLDSLIAIQKFENDSAQIKTYFKIAKIYAGDEQNDTANFRVYVEKSFQLAKQSKNKLLMAEALAYKGKFYGYQSNIDSAIYYLNNSVQLYQKLNDSLGLASTYLIMSDVFHRNYRFKEPVSYAIKAIKIYEHLHREDLMVDPLYNLALVFNRQKDYIKTLHYLKRAFILSEKEKITPVYKAKIISQLARSYGNLYENKNYASYLDSTFKYAQISLEYSHKHGLLYSELNSLDIIYGYYYSKKDYTTAIKLLDEVLAKAANFSNKHLCTGYRRKSDLLLILDQPKEASILADSALAVAKRMDWKSHIMYSYAVIYESNKALGNYKKSIFALEQFNQLQNEIVNLETATAINDLEKKYETEKKDAEIQKLNQENEINDLKIVNQNIQIRFLIGLGIIACLIIVILFFIFRQKSIKSDMAILESELKLNRTRMNPHMFFNTLTTLQNKTVSEKDPLIISQTISDHALVMRKTLEYSFTEYISLEEEIDYLELYLNLYKTSFNFSFSIIVAPEIDDITDISIPGMLIQPFIENSIEHGFHQIDYAGKITIEFRLIDNSLEIMVTDNGKNEADKKEKDQKKISRATQIITDRLNLIQQKYKAATYFNISKHGINTRVKIRVPVIIE